MSTHAARSKSTCFRFLASAGKLLGRAFDGYFIDIDVPDAFARSQREIPRRVGVRPPFLTARAYSITIIGSRSRFRWTDGAKGDREVADRC
jgi:NDP-sugar pyrophosphorylase family protein